MRITRKWLLLSIGILAVVLVGFSVPQAVGHTASPFNIQHVLADIIAVAAQVTAVDAKVTDLQDDINAVLMVPLNGVKLPDDERMILVDGFGTGTTFDAEITYRFTGSFCGLVVLQYLPASATPGVPDEWVSVSFGPYPEVKAPEVSIPNHVDLTDIKALSILKPFFGAPDTCVFDDDDYVSVTILG